MPVLLHQQPVLTLALDSFQDTTIDESDIRRMWILFTKCKDDIKNGFRLENISWRIWYKKYLNNTSDLFSHDKLYNKSIDNHMVHSVESNGSSFSTIEPIEVLKKCACGEQLISSSLNSLSTPHSEYTCFNKFSCSHHHHTTSPKQDSLDTKNSNNKVKSLESSENTLVQPSAISEVQTEKIIDTPSENNKVESIVKEQTVPKEEESSTVKIITDISNEIPDELQKSPETQINDTNTNTNVNTISTTENNENVNTNSETNPNPTVNNTNTQIPTIEQFYQQQLLLLQQMYIQKQQQLQYQKQQMNANPEHIYQQQVYLQQWYNQQQQQLLSNCSAYYRRYLQQIAAQQQQQQQTQASQQPQQNQAEPLNEEDEDDFDDEEEDDYYYSDEDDDIIDDYEEEGEGEEKEEKEEKENDEEVVEVEQKSEKDDLFKKVSTPTLKRKTPQTSLLSTMIKENSYNEYKKTVEIIQKYNDDAQESSNNIYSIKDYNHNCINSLNKNNRRKRAPSFEDVRNAQQGFRRLFEMCPLNAETTQEAVNIDIEEYYEKGANHHHTSTCNGTNNSYSTVNTVNSQDSHSTLYSNNNNPNPYQNGIYGSNKTTHSTKSTKSTRSFINNRTTTNNSVNLYLNKKRVNYSN